MQKKVDALGFDKFELANVKRCAAANKSNYKKIDALKERILALGKLLRDAEALAETWDAPAKQMSMSKLGIELTAREIVYYHNNPEQLHIDFPELAAVPEAQTEEAEAEGIQNDDIPF